MTIKQKLLFILVFGPALLIVPIAFVFTAFRLAWTLGETCAEHLLGTQLDERRKKP